MNGLRILTALTLAALGVAGGWWLRGAMEPPARPAAASGDPWQERFAAATAEPALAGALVGFCVLDETGGVVHASPLAEAALCPASALKSLTAGAALGLLGRDFRFETELRSGATLSADGVLAGDLVLHGSGDPTLTAADLAALAARLANAGLRHVTGSLRADASVFPEAAANDHWVWGDLGNAYGVGAFGINVGHNVVRLAFQAGAEGSPAEFLGTSPDLPDIRWDVAVTAGAPGSGDGVTIYSAPYADRITVRGTVPAGARDFTVRGAVPDPPALAVHLLEKALSERGVTFGKGTADGRAETVLASHRSAPLVEIIGHMQEVSDNLEAQCLFLTLGPAPAARLEQFWRDRGVDFRGLRLLDGSGLARATMIRPLDLARVNHAARQADFGADFIATLPASDGGRVRSKRGAMSGVRSEAGFLTRGGRTFTFALMANGLRPEADFWELRDRLLAEVGK